MTNSNKLKLRKAIQSLREIISDDGGYNGSTAAWAIDNAVLKLEKAEELI